LLRGADNFTRILHAMGLPMSQTFVWITVVTEIIGGLCILLGAFRWSAFFLPFAAVLFLIAAAIWLN
jgi:putative oxidoreductase